MGALRVRIHALEDQIFKGGTDVGATLRERVCELLREHLRETVIVEEGASAARADDELNGAAARAEAEAAESLAREPPSSHPRRGPPLDRNPPARPARARGGAQSRLAQRPAVRARPVSCTLKARPVESEW